MLNAERRSLQCLDSERLMTSTLQEQKRCSISSRCSSALRSHSASSSGLALIRFGGRFSYAVGVSVVSVFFFIITTMIGLWECGNLAFSARFPSPVETVLRFPWDVTSTAAFPFTSARPKVRGRLYPYRHADRGSWPLLRRRFLIGRAVRSLAGGVPTPFGVPCATLRPAVRRRPD